MRRAEKALACAALALLRGASPAATADPPSIVRIALRPESEERSPLEVPTEPENTVELDLPWPVADWAGRGFTPDPDRYAGDFVVEATRGMERLFVTPVTGGAHRILDVVLAEPGGLTRGLPIEFVPAPAGLAWRKVVISENRAAPDSGPLVALDKRVPRSRYRRASADSELGLITTLRLMLNTTAEGAALVARSNPSLELRTLGANPRSFGPFTLMPRFALRDTTTDSLGICVGLSNTTGRRLLFEPSSWVVRVGDRVYPVGTVDFSHELGPHEDGAAFLVLTQGPDGRLPLLSVDNPFEISVVLKAEVSARPVSRLPLPSFEPR